jgi:hypothetical protein
MHMAGIWQHSLRVLGFRLTHSRAFAQGLREHASQNEVVRIEDSPFGKRYIVEGELSAPDKRKPRVRVIWFIKIGQNAPLLVTAYPLERT